MADLNNKKKVPKYLQDMQDSAMTSGGPDLMQAIQNVRQGVTPDQAPVGPTAGEETGMTGPGAVMEQMRRHGMQPSQSPQQEEQVRAMQMAALKNAADKANAKYSLDNNLDENNNPVNPNDPVQQQRFARLRAMLSGQK